MGSNRRVDAGEVAVRVAPTGALRSVSAVALSVAAAVVAWQGVVLATDLPAVVLPAPAAVARAGLRNAGSLADALAYTAVEVVVGWTAGVLVGATFAGAMAWSAPVKRTIYPSLVAVRIVPLIVVAPVLIVLLGPTLLTRSLLATLLVFFPVTVATLDGLRATPDDQLALLRSVGASRWTRFRHVRVPNALPGVFGGLEIATPLAIEGAILAEFLAEFLAGRRGIGVVLLEAGDRLQTALLFAAMLALVAFGVALFGAVHLCHRAVSWEESSDSLGVSLLGADGGTAGFAGGRVAAPLGLAAAVLVGLWYVAATVFPTAHLFLASPAAVVDVLAGAPELFVSAAAATVRTLAVGWLLGAGVGFALGATAALVDRARVPIVTYLAGFRVMPTVAFAPVLLVWFGVSSASAAVLVAASTFFPVAIGTATGLRRLPPGYDDLLRSVDAPPWRALAVRFRYGVPELFAGVKLSTITGLSGVVVAEWFVASDGLGVLVLEQTRTFQADLSFAAIAVLFAVGASLFGLAAALQRRLQY